MTALSRIAYLVFLLSGVAMLLGPIVFELNPWAQISAYFSRVQFLVFELFAALTAFWASRVSHHHAPLACLGAAGCAALSMGIGLWMVLYLGTPEAVFLTATPLVVAIACCTIFLVLSASLIAVGAPLTLIVSAMQVFGYVGQFVPRIASVSGVGFSSYVTYLTLGSSGLLGRAIDIITGVVVVFVIFGAFFDVAGGGQVISKAALRIARNGRTGAIKACVVASGLFATISGTATSNVLMSGPFTIPSMRQIGVRRETAAGIEAAASTCGQIMPPVLGAAAFFLADLAEKSYLTVVIAAVLPALACYYALFRQARFVKLEPVEPAALSDTQSFGPADLFFLLPPVVIIAVLLWSEVFVSLAAIAGIACCLAVAVILSGAGTSLRVLCKKLPSLITSVMQLIIAAAAIGLLLGVLHITGVALAAAIRIEHLGAQSLLLALLLTGLLTFVLGMGIATVGVYIIAATLLVPGLINAGIAPLAAHFFVLYCGILSMLTPPVAFASLAASGLAGADFFATSLEALRFGWMLIVMPFVIVLQPGLLMLGDWSDVLMAIVLTLTLITLVTVPGLGRLTKGTLCSIALAALIWRGADWVAGALALVAIAGLWLVPPLVNARTGGRDEE